MRVFLVLSLFGLSLNLAVGQQTIGLFENDSTAFDGYTLFAPTTNDKAYLIDNCGELIRSWDTNYTPGMDVELLPDGRLVRAARWNGSFNAGGVGGRIEIYNWEGELEWGYIYADELVHQHHDFEVLPNGNILLLAWEDKTEAEAIQAGRDPDLIGLNGVWPDHVVEIEPFGINQGNIVWEWHAWDHLVQDYDPDKDNFGVVADHPELINVNYGVGNGSADWMHCNSIDYVEEFDQIIIGSRDFNEFWIIDHSTTSAEAAGHTGGNFGKGGDVLYRWGNPAAYDRGTPADQKLFGQHHVHYIKGDAPYNGKIILYNNGAGRPDGAYSTVEILDPPVDENGFYEQPAPGETFGPETLFWVYGNGLNQFYSPNVSGATQLPNGNVLFCVGSQGLFLEVTLAGEVVWEYKNPVAQNGPNPQGTNPPQNAVFRTYRYPADFPAFEGKDLTPQGPLELDPLPSDCVLYPEPGLASVSGPIAVEGLQLLQNPVSQWLSLENTGLRNLHVEVFDLAGRKVFSTRESNEQIQIDISRLHNGMYILKVNDVEQRNAYSIFKLIKHD
ncbi:MAG: T9SS type A sorting domain-containing protein [Bacteroidetes bacterium]|nr:T9SS type A sorting domain-containing protein [Bacteroidota bacterium]